MEITAGTASEGNCFGDIIFGIFGAIGRGWLKLTFFLTFVDDADLPTGFDEFFEELLSSKLPSADTLTVAGSICSS